MDANDNDKIIMGIEFEKQEGMKKIESCLNQMDHSLSFTEV